jgi:outer membrane lipoprotein-sorting protein
MAGAGDNVRAFDGQNAWNTSEGTFMPIPVVTLSGGDLLGAKLDAALSFPGQIKQLLSNWTANFSPTSLDDDTVVNVVQGMQPDNTPVKFFFDQKTGLLRRQVRYSDTPIGLNPAQIDYEDYRDVAGVKMPFKITVTWTDGRSEIELTRVQPNVAVEASRFAKPQAAHR